ncbi:MAG: DUF488 domain-containing protein [candidate division WOR-3 bacterium]
MSKIIYTLGTGTRRKESFFKIIKDKNIDIIVDVRRFPTSKFEEFKKKHLEQSCSEEGIVYLYFGNELGGFRRGGYEGYMKTDEFTRGINEIVKISYDKTICIICAETLPWKCHRRFIARKLMEMGYEVIHIIDERRTWEQKLSLSSSRKKEGKLP